MTSEPLTAFIFARGGSKGVRNKNIRPVAGKPLIAHTIACALCSTHVAQVVVSTDSQEIADIAEEHGARALLRPGELAADNTPEILAWRHAIEACPDIFGDDKTALFISLPATSPLRSAEDIDAGIAKFREGGCDIVFGISPARHNPYLSMAAVNKDNLLEIAMSGSNGARRQDMPEIYDITGCVYIANPAYIMHTERLIDGRVAYIEIPPERALDIDTEYDLYLADLLLTHPFKKGGQHGAE